MNEEFSNSDAIDTELQVRLMNLVMGEASDFECDQLQLLMEQRPEVAAYYQHLGHLHGLLCQVGAGEPSMDIDASVPEDAWQLPADRRERVLAVLDGVADKKHTITISTNTSNRSLWSRWATAGGLVTAASVLLCLMLLPSVQSRRSAATKFTRRFDGKTDGSLYSYLNEPAPSPPDAAVTNAERGATLPNAYYLNDDVQYFAPAPNRYIQPGRSTTPPSVGVTGNFSGRSSGSMDAAGKGGSASDVDFGMVDADGLIPDREKIRAKEKLGGAGSGPPEGYLGNSIANFDVAESKLHHDFSDDYVRAIQLGQTMVPTKPNEPGLDKWQSNGRGSAVEWDNGLSDLDAIAAATLPPSTEEPRAVPLFSSGTPGQQPSFGYRLDALESAPSLTINEWHDSHPSDTSTLMMTVTPKIIVPDGEEKVLEEMSGKQVDRASRYRRLLLDNESKMANDFMDPKLPMMYPTTDVWGEFAAQPNDRFGSSILPADIDRQTNVERQFEGGNKGQKKEDSAAQKAKPDQAWRTELDKFSDLQGSDKTQERELKEESVVAQNEKLPDLNQTSRDQQLQATDLYSNPLAYDSRLRDLKGKASNTSGDSLGRETAGLRLHTPAPSPEAVSSNRGREAVELNAQLAERKQVEAIDEQSATAQAFSTFSLHVSDVSFKLAQAALSQGQWPEAAKVRIEEFVNALDYHDPLPSGNQKVACRVEQAIHPFLMQRNLLRVSMRTAATGRSQNTPLRLTLLLDNSGSMERPDRRQAVVRAFQTLTAQLSAADQVTLISFANSPRLLADKVSGNQGETLLQIIENLPSEGGTNIEAGLLLAREKAIEQQLAGAQNRIVLLTDGAVNLGDASPANLSKLVTQLRDDGIAFDAAGISAQDLNDEILEALTRRGDGRYYLLDSAEAASESFAAQIAGALRPSAQNVKVQVEFNPQRVGRYKLLGFEKHRLNQEDFRNDKVDAAELAASEAGVAVYQFEIKPNGKGDVGSVSVRFRDLSSDQMVERRWPIPYEPIVARLEKAEASMQLAATAALFAAKLTGGPIADNVDLAELHKLLSNLPEECASQPRVQQLRAMIGQALSIKQ